MISKPLSDLCDNYNAISELAHKEGEPIYLIKDGKIDLVVMSIEAFERYGEAQQLRATLTAAEQAKLLGTPAVSMEESRERLGKIYGTFGHTSEL